MSVSTDLEDAALRDFIARGDWNIDIDLPAAFHEGVRARLEELSSRDEDLENGVLWRIPELHQVFDHPAVRAALARVLGPGYIMNPHTYCHLSRPGSSGHGWHKDSYILDHNTRHPRPRWLMALYTPHDLTEALGPTTIIPGWQYHEYLDDPVEQSQGVALAGKAGTVTLLHPDEWHGARPNRSQENRFLFKFLFERRWEPSRHAQPREAAAWRKSEADLVPLLSRDVWRWLRGEHASEVQPFEDGSEAAILLRALDSGSETLALRAAYALAGFGPPVVAPLAAALRGHALEAAETLGARRPSDPKGINPTVLPPALALAAIGAPATAALVELAGDSHWYVRAVVADTLGNIGPAAAGAIPCLTRLAQDSHWWVRRNAIEALGRIGASAASAGEAMTRGLADADVRVRLNAAVALGKVAEPPAYAIPALQQASERDENRYVRYYARLALQYATSQGAVEDSAPVRSGWQTMLPIQGHAAR
jgi:hypothetical protein